MPADRIGDPGTHCENVRARMETLVSALTGGAGSPFEEPFGGFDGDESVDDDITEPPRGASQDAVAAAIRRVESDEGTQDTQEREKRDDHVIV